MKTMVISNKRILMVLLAILILAIGYLIFYTVKNSTFNLLKFDKDKAILLIKGKYPELADYPSDKLPPRAIVVDQDTDGLYVGFMQNGSGRPLLEARCFMVSPDYKIT